MKHNTDEGFVEVLLHEPSGRNPRIRRVLSATNNSSTYLINGKAAKASDVRGRGERGRERGGREGEGERERERGGGGREGERERMYDDGEKEVGEGRDR